MARTSTRPRSAAKRQPVQARSRATRERLLRSALGLIARRGVGGMTLRGVSERAGVSTGVATYHFANREQLLVEAFRFHLERVRHQAASLSGAPSAAGGIRFLETLLDERTEDLLAGFEIMLEFARRPELRARVERDGALAKAFAGEWLARSGAAHSRDDSALLVAVLQGLAIDGLSHPGDPAVRTQLRRTLRRTLKLIGT